MAYLEKCIYDSDRSDTPGAASIREFFQTKFHFTCEKSKMRW